MSGTTNAQLLSELKDLRNKDLAEIKAKLDHLNGRVRETEQVQASLVQSRHNHDRQAEEMKDEIKALRGRTNWVGAGLALAQVVVGALLFGNDGKP